jgi:glucosamine-6-phosphate deaminase
MTTLRTYDASSSVEAAEYARTARKPRYAPTEKVRVLEVDNFPQLGRLTALRFVEWVAKNPGGVISLPTGKTPEHFIRWVKEILSGWETPKVRALLETYGIDPGKKPDMGSLSFVQIDEFYPMNALQQNSFHWYVSEYYLRGFGLDPAKALLIDATSLGLTPGTTMEEVFPRNVVDLSLRVRQTRSDLERLQKEVINRVDMFCMEYETKIRAMGGIGFFLGGIGPDGHIAFNVRGSSVFSVTRLTGTNYETQAAAATDLGGIEIARNRLVITIGLATITHNPTSTVIVMAAGDAKAGVIRQAVEEKKHQQYPASVLQDLPHAAFYLTRGAASLLSERRLEDFSRATAHGAEEADDAVIGLSISTGRPLLELTEGDFRGDPFTARLLAEGPHQAFARAAHDRIVERIERGLAPVTGTQFLHTEPHHDDIMLGYLAYIYHLVRDPGNRHAFANLTSGFTSVSNDYCRSIVQKLQAHLPGDAFGALMRDGYFSSTNAAARMEDVYLYLDGAAAQSEERKGEAEARRLLRNLIAVYGSEDMKVLRLRIKELDEYLATQYPGAKDPPDVQTIKGSLREWEVELLWAYFGIEAKDIHALRLGFYRGAMHFTEEPQVDRDVVPIFELLRSIRPGIVSVAFDPEGSGPDTHYKVLQAVAEALRLYEESSGGAPVRVWGYRNVWYRFRPAEADVMVPVSLNTLSLLHTAFMNCFGSQRAASFPSYEHDGPFSELAQKIQVEQYAMIKTCLGKEFFQSHSHPRLRAARGMIFLKDMTLPQFYEKVRALKKLIEARE